MPKTTKKKHRKAQKRLRSLLRDLEGPSVCSENTSILLWEYYRTAIDALFNSIKPKREQINHHTKLLVGFPEHAYHGVFHDFPLISLKNYNKTRIERPTPVDDSEALSLSLVPRHNPKQRFLREIDGTQSEQHFEDLANFCSFQLCTRGSGKRLKFGWGNYIWFGGGTLVIITRLTPYLYYNNKNRPVVKISYDCVTFKPAICNLIIHDLLLYLSYTIP